MRPSAETLAVAIGAAAAQELTKAHERIRHCVLQLDDVQIWRRQTDAMNSIGNLILHLCGNLRQWIIAGVGGAPDVRQRPLEFSERGPIARDELLRRLDAVVGQACEALRRASAEVLLRTRHIQEFDVTGLEAIFDSVPHFRGHTQEIIHITRSMLGDAYRFAWTPQKGG
ncbi:MAG TPA: DUF1572 family protein [Gemmataceae bacterium]|nr:DUF1572 family protein [Gemmataceae bacterium]